MEFAENAEYSIGKSPWFPIDFVVLVLARSLEHATACATSTEGMSTKFVFDNIHADLQGTRGRVSNYISTMTRNTAHLEDSDIWA